MYPLGVGLGVWICEFLAARVRVRVQRTLWLCIHICGIHLEKTNFYVFVVLFNFIFTASDCFTFLFFPTSNPTSKFKLVGRHFYWVRNEISPFLEKYYCSVVHSHELNKSFAERTMSSDVCRTCLSRDNKMHSIRNIELREIYEKLTNTKVNTIGILESQISCYTLRSYILYQKEPILQISHF